MCFDKDDAFVLYHMQSAPAYNHFGKSLSYNRLRSIFAAKKQKLETQKNVAMEKKVQKEKESGRTRYSGSSGDAYSGIKLGPACLLPGSWAWCIGKMV